MASFTGISSIARDVRHVIVGYSEWSFAGTVGRYVVANQILAEEVVLFPCRLGAVGANAAVAGAGAGNTVLDMQVARASAPTSFTSVWTNATGNRPTLASASTGGFTIGGPPLFGNLLPGDVVLMQVLSIPATQGHSRVTFSVALEDTYVPDPLRSLRPEWPRP